jgi:anti-sigma B factor antagonist
VSSTGDFDAQLVPVSDGTYVVRVVGDLDMATAPRLEECIESIADASRLVIDLTPCTFLDSAAVRLLTTVARDSGDAGKPLALVASDPGILRVLEITAVNDILPVHSTLDEALGELPNG